MSLIKELAEKALWQSLVHDGVYRPKGCANYVSKSFADNFAELIIKEFITATHGEKFNSDELAGNSHRHSFNNGLHHAASNIQQHFGIKK